MTSDYDPSGQVKLSCESERGFFIMSRSGCPQPRSAVNANAREKHPVRSFRSHDALGRPQHHSGSSLADKSDLRLTKADATCPAFQNTQRRAGRVDDAGVEFSQIQDADGLLRHDLCLNNEMARGESRAQHKKRRKGKKRGARAVEPTLGSSLLQAKHTATCLRQPANINTIQASDIGAENCYASM